MQFYSSLLAFRGQSNFALPYKWTFEQEVKKWNYEHEMMKQEMIKQEMMKQEMMKQEMMKQEIMKQ